MPNKNLLHELPGRPDKHHRNLDEIALASAFNSKKNAFYDDCNMDQFEDLNDFDELLNIASSDEDEAESEAASDEEEAPAPKRPRLPQDGQDDSSDSDSDSLTEWYRPGQAEETDDEEDFAEPTASQRRPAHLNVTASSSSGVIVARSLLPRPQAPPSSSVFPS